MHTDYDYEYRPKPRRHGGGSWWVSFFTALLVAAGTSTAMHLWVLPKWLPMGEARAEVFVPQLVGLELSAATTTLKALRLRLKLAGRQFHPKAAGTILSQIPAPGVRMRQGQAVRVVLSLGPMNAPQPSHSTVPTPRAATPAPVRAVRRERPRDTANTIAVPRVLRSSISRAKQRIKRAGLKVGRITYGADEDVGPHLILRQIPRPGLKVPPGTPVDLVVNRGDL